LSPHLFLLWAAPAFGQYAALQEFDPIVVTASRSATRGFDVPASVDVIDARTLHEGQPQVNLSETLARVPGVFAGNRQNYAQDLQVSSRGFGARATFGVRGLRLYQDGIPVTMPDGQGQTGSFSLLSAQRVEVLRGPFSTLYGNASGGVIAVFTEDPVAPAGLLANFGSGSYGARTFGGKASMAQGAVGGLLAATRFETDGYREHSAARRDVANGKLVIAVGDSTRVTVIANSQYQPETQDPLGLTRAQWEQDPRGVDPAALFFDTRKTIRQSQGGVSVSHAAGSPLAFEAAAYGGRRKIRQYLALSGVGETSSGGVTDLDRDFSGIGGRAVWTVGSMKLTAGADTDRQHERRRGFVNQAGDLGDLRRDEDDDVRSVDGYAQLEYSPWPEWTFSGGVRSSVVRYDSVDHYITAQNPDDSGSRRFRDTSPVLGVVWRLSEALRLYASYGEGFETPTFAELAYRTGGTGLNLDLQPATSRAFEVGMKALPAPGHRATLAAFATRTQDEIVIDAATGGRTVFKNAGRTRRHGMEAAWSGEFPCDVRGSLALTWLVAEFADAFTSGNPPVTVAPGSRLPGVPSRQAYGELAWRPRALSGWSVAIEGQYVDRIFVNDRNSDSAPAYAVANARIGYELRRGALRFAAFGRLNNLFDRRYSGSVIVGDTNGRFFEPAPGRNWFAGVDIGIAL
jgi:iron complex outermembrane receptor protein